MTAFRSLCGHSTPQKVAGIAGQPCSQQIGMRWGPNVRSAARFGRWLTFLAYADGFFFLSWSPDTSQLLDCIEGFCLGLGLVVSAIINEASLFNGPSMPVSSLGKPLPQMASLNAWAWSSMSMAACHVYSIEQPKKLPVPKLSSWQNSEGANVGSPMMGPSLPWYHQQFYMLLIDWLRTDEGWWFNYSLLRSIRALVHVPICDNFATCQNMSLLPSLSGSWLRSLEYTYGQARPFASCTVSPSCLISAFPQTSSKTSLWLFSSNLCVAWAAGVVGQYSSQGLPSAFTAPGITSQVLLAHMDGPLCKV